MTQCPGCGCPWEHGSVVCAVCAHDTGIALVTPGAEFAGVDPSFADPPIGPVTGKRAGVTWGGGKIIAGIILAILSLILAALVASKIGSWYPEQKDAVATWIAVHLMALFIVTSVWFLGLRHSANPLAALGLSAIHWPKKRTVLLMVVVLATSLFATSLYAGIVDWLDVDVLSPPAVESDIMFDGLALVLTFQALAFITPLTEEIFFRGFIFGGLLPRLGPWRAMVASALVFSAFHISLDVLIPIFITGFLFAWLYWRTGSLWAAIGAHAGQNGLALFVVSQGG